jgi:hypothetical protein
MPDAEDCLKNGQQDRALAGPLVMAARLERFSSSLFVTGAL